MRKLLAAFVCCALLIGSADAQIGGLSFPGPGPVKSSGGGGGSVTFDANSGANAVSVTGTTLTISSQTVGAGSGRGLLVTLLFGSSTAPTGLACTWDVGGTNQAMTAISGTLAQNGGATATSEIFGLLAPTSGNKTLTCSWTGSTEAHAASISFTGVNQTNFATAFPNGASAFQGSSVAGPASVPVTSATGHQVVAVFGQACAVWGTVSGTQFGLDVTTGPNLGVVSAYNSGAATVTMSAAFTGTCTWNASGTDVSP